MHHKLLWFALCIALAAGCGPLPDPLRVLVADYTDDSHTQFGLREVELTTVENFDSLRNEYLDIQPGVEITFNVYGDFSQSPEGMRSSTCTAPRDLNLQYAIDGDVVVPLDFDTLNILTAYYHLEQTVLAFNQLNWDAAQDGPVPVYYHADFDGGLLLSLDSDNAAYITYLDGFLVLPMKMLDDIPLPMNQGVLAHEYAHRVLHYNIYGRDIMGVIMRHFETGVAEEDILNAVNRIKSFDEGCADYFGAYVTKDPAFMQHSLPEVMFAERDLRSHYMVTDPLWLTGEQPTVNAGGLGGAQFDPYKLGVVYASALYRLGQQVGDQDAVAQAVLLAQLHLSSAVQNNLYFEHRWALEAIVANLPQQYQGQACTIFSEQFAALEDVLEGCP